MSAATTTARTSRVRIWSTDIDPASCCIASKSMSNGKKICLGYGGCARICYRGAMQEPSVRTSRLAIAGGLAAILVVGDGAPTGSDACSDEHRSELQSIRSIAYDGSCLTT